MGKTGIPRNQLKQRALALLKSAEEVLLEGASRATGFEDAEDFKRALISDLEAFQPFHEAVHEYHGLHAVSGGASGSGAKGSRNTMGSKNIIQKGSGHVQASRFDPSSNQKDRRRGKRQPGGKRIGKGRGAKG